MFKFEGGENEQDDLVIYLFAFEYVVSSYLYTPLGW